jgi:methylated-DNA-[protein]-cysteine S-methyltransferase
MYYSTTHLSPLGPITLASDEDNLIGLWLDKQKYHGDATFTNMVEGDDIPVLNAAKKWLDSYFAGLKPDINMLPLAPKGSPFRQQVWAILRDIPYGQVVTYQDIAMQIAAQRCIERMSCQAIGGAVGHNPISIIIPCHRVVGKSGSLTGYAGGIDLKVRLLEHEGVDMSRLYAPKTGTAI